MTHKSRKATYHGAYVRVIELDGGYIVEQYNFLAGNWISATTSLASSHEAYKHAVALAAALLLKAVNDN